MGDRDKEEQAQILTYIGDVLRADAGGLTDAASPLLAQVVQLIRQEQLRQGAAATPLLWEDLPEELRRLLEQLRAADQGPTEV